MSQQTATLREFLPRFLKENASITELPPKRDTSQKVHLSVYQTKGGKPFAVEYNKKNLQNIWVRKQDADFHTPADLKVTHKRWVNGVWRGDDNKGANSNLRGYEEFKNHDLVRFGVTTKDEALLVLNSLSQDVKQRRYLLKVDGKLNCPNGICRPASDKDWADGEVLIPSSGPIHAIDGAKPSAPSIQSGDEIWIWAHEDEKFGSGWGLTARAIAGDTRESGEFLAVRMHRVERLERPFGFRDLGEGATGSRLLDHTRVHRQHQAYLIEDEDYAELLSLVSKKTRELPEEVRHSRAEGWELEVLTHKDAILEGLKERRVTKLKPRTGQAKFRADLMDYYKGRCTITKCPIPEALEAAHVMPHTGDPKWDQRENGMLLRRDLHAMFDAMLWSIDPKNNKLRVTDRLKTSAYGKLDGQEIKHGVAKPLLEVHFRQFKKETRND